MNYQRLTLLCFLCLSVQFALANSNCADAYTSASYALSHSKKSLKAYNFEHQQYYAGRALEAMEKTRDLIGACGCDAALNAIEDSIENLEKALNPEDWDMGRYFTKRAVADAYLVLENLDVCSSEPPSEHSPDKARADATGKVEEPRGADRLYEQEELARTLKAEAALKLSRMSRDLQELTALLTCENGKALLDNWPETADWTGSFSDPDAIRDHYAQETQKMYEEALRVLAACREN